MSEWYWRMVEWLCTACLAMLVLGCLLSFVAVAVTCAAEVPQRIRQWWERWWI